MTTLKLKLLSACTLITFSLVVPAFGQKVWEKKPYPEWSMSEVIRVLDDSPWAQTQFEGGQADFRVTIRLRSALTIRQALIRQRQLQLNYERFPPAEKARFDADAKLFLDCADCARYYIVTLDSPSNHPSPLRALKDLSPEDLKPNVSLVNDRGERRELVGFIPPKGEGEEALFLFRRFDEQGKPLLTGDSKRFSFKIEPRVFEGKTPAPLKKFTFDVPKLIRDGKVEF